MESPLQHVTVIEEVSLVNDEDNKCMAKEDVIAVVDDVAQSEM